MTFGQIFRPGQKSVINKMDCKPSDSVLEIGIGTGLSFKYYPDETKVIGIDISPHMLAQAKEKIKKDLYIQRAQEIYPFKEKQFDLVISLGCLHNLRIFELEVALKEIERVGKQGYIMLESYRNEKELFNLQCWALTCESFFDHKEWIWIYNHFGYTGDYEFIYFE